MKTSFLYILFLSAFVHTEAAVKRIEIFSEPNQRGDSIILAEKVPDLKDWKFFLEKATSYCVTGFWTFYELTNYSWNSVGLFGDGGEEFAFERRKCDNFSGFGDFNSARYIGPADTRTVAVSIYEVASAVLGDIEVVIEGTAGTNFPMNRTGWIVSHGRSNWTLFTENNFQGRSWCFQENENLFNEALLNSTSPVRSVIRGCE